MRLRSTEYVCHRNSCEFKMYVLSRFDTTRLKCPLDDGMLVMPVKKQGKWWKFKRLFRQKLEALGIGETE